MRTWSVLTWVFVAVFTAEAAEQSPSNRTRPEIAAAPVLEDRYPQRTIDFGVAEGLPDLVFAVVPGFRPLRLDLYRPKSAATPRPLVIYVHGGGWQGGHTRHSGAFESWPSVLASLAAKGYVVASLEYRLSSEAPFPAAFDDVKAALAWLRTQAGKYGIDPTRVVLWGGSAGGHLAALTATSCGDAGSWSTSKSATCVQGLVAWYGIFDFASILQTEGARDANAPAAGHRFLDCLKGTCDPNVVKKASPIAFVDSRAPPTLLIHGRRDAVVAVDQSINFYDALRAKGVTSTLKIIEGVDHSFIGATPQQTRDASLAALDATFDFIDATIGDRT